MNTNTHFRGGSLWPRCAALVLAASVTGAFAAPAPAANENEKPKEVMSTAPVSSNPRELVGQQVWTSDNEPIGTVSDVVMDANSNRPAYLLVASRGLFSPVSLLHVVPFDAAHPAGTAPGIKANVTSARWNEVPILSDQDYQSGKLALADFDRQTLVRMFDDAKSLPQPNARLVSADHSGNNAVNAEAPAGNENGMQKTYTNVPNVRNSTGGRSRR